MSGACRSACATAGRKLERSSGRTGTTALVAVVRLEETTVEKRATGVEGSDGTGSKERK